MQNSPTPNPEFLVPTTPETVRTSPIAMAEERLNTVQTGISSLPREGVRIAANLAGAALPIIGTIYLVRAGILTCIGRPPQWLRNLA